MFDVSRLTTAQQQHHSVMLLQHYHELCNTNDTSSMFLSPPPIPNIESLSQDEIGTKGDKKHANREAKSRLKHK